MVDIFLRSDSFVWLFSCVGGEISGDIIAELVPKIEAGKLTEDFSLDVGEGLEIEVGFLAGTLVEVGALVEVGVLVGVGVCVLVGELVGVGVSVGVEVGLGVGVGEELLVEPLEGIERIIQEPLSSGLFPPDCPVSGTEIFPELP